MDISSINGLSSYDNVLNSKISETKETSFEDKLKLAMEDKNEEELKNACMEFESYFINLLFKQMRNTVNEGEGFIKKNQAELTFTDMLYEEVSTDLTKAGGIGIADMMYKQMEKQL